MNENLLQYWNRAKQYWTQFSKTQKLTLIATVIIVILTIGIISYNLSKTEYALAYTNLQPSDAAAIKAYLDEAKIPYQLSEDGKSIGVPRSQVADVKLGVESQGLNKNGNIGYGSFNQSSTFGTTDREFDVKYLNAVQGELQQLINSNTAINSSKVLINLPKESVFLPAGGEPEKASASVVLDIKPGYSLDQAKIDTMYNLVSHSIKDLPIENITISDQNGNLLEYSKGQNQINNASNMAMQQFEINNKFRNDVQRNVQQMLGGILGRDKVIVSVFSTMNFDQTRRKEQLVTAPNTVDQTGLDISIQEIQKNYTSDGAQQGGVPGTGATDVPGYPGTANNGRTNSEELQRTVNREVNRITNEIVLTPYVVKDLTINVGIEPPDPLDINSLTPQTIEAVRQILVNIVRAALADSGTAFTEEELARKVTVFPQTFARTNDNQGVNANSMLLYGALGGLALALLGGGAYWWIRRRRAQQEVDEEIVDETPKVEFPTIDIDNVNNENQVRKQLEQLAKRKPEEFVNLLRTWLVEE
ncbi:MULTISPECIES: flagellar basal-body MS-ring/collar protein FliF [Paenibacillus]|uniref:Flagellar M-ring protein n=1 Tax=Paenibacillus naphthalenovorans TaxID=162209 RepID=A0A0U2MVD5_9BACL|nr:MULTISPECIES: flagellar basal-body MS-ring/collar protein FliF [Paenibacillus]ALS21631.1 flagellar M-ring protein FliF [Paenibacillus naphthalenovorans]NTZ18215.1 flagellar M-ring protein FliF [Paenibacillus sp. JMULE4]GCL71358.1 flagellar M-ring protein FliF [Paenibacillus naphthalenovorans]SDI86941.1 flagellar M-ring protein FliF [Paenibacillus naphthalenovorans]